MPNKSEFSSSSRVGGTFEALRNIQATISSVCPNTFAFIQGHSKLHQAPLDGRISSIRSLPEGSETLAASKLASFKSTFHCCRATCYPPIFVCREFRGVSPALDLKLSTPRAERQFLVDDWQPRYLSASLHASQHHNAEISHAAALPMQRYRTSYHEVT